MAGKGFRVDTDKLQDVATKVKALLDDVSGNTGYIAGNKPDFDQAEPTQLQNAIKGLWNNSNNDPFTTGYRYEHDGIVKTYESMVTQLTNLHIACQSTVDKYKEKDGQSKKTVNASNNGQI